MLVTAGKGEVQGLLAESYVQMTSFAWRDDHGAGTVFCDVCGWGCRTTLQWWIRVKAIYFPAQRLQVHRAIHQLLPWNMD